MPEDLGGLFYEKQVAYCHALRDDEELSPVRIKLGSLEGAVACGYRGARAGDKTSLPWIAPILSCEILSRTMLKESLRKFDWPATRLPSSASAYLLFRLGTPSLSGPRKVTALTPRGSFQAVSCSMVEFQSCPGAVNL